MITPKAEIDPYLVSKPDGLLFPSREVSREEKKNGDCAKSFEARKARVDVCPIVERANREIGRRALRTVLRLVAPQD